MHSKEKLSFPL